MGRRRILRIAAAIVIFGGSAGAFLSPAIAQGAIDLDRLTAVQAAADLCAGKITSKALTTAALARAKANQNLNAFITLDEAGALKAAEAFDAGRKKASCRPLGGLPIVIKDNIEVAGLPASAGTQALKGYMPKRDAPVAAKLRAAGAIIIGKTNMHELAFGISGYNSAFKTGSEPGVRNAYDSTKVAGGSSSGSAAAIGARCPARSTVAPRCVRPSAAIPRAASRRSRIPAIRRGRWHPPWRTSRCSTASSPVAWRFRRQN